MLVTHYGMSRELQSHVAQSHVATFWQKIPVFFAYIKFWMKDFIVNCSLLLLNCLCSLAIIYSIGDLWAPIKTRRKVIHNMFLISKENIGPTDAISISFPMRRLVNHNYVGNVRSIFSGAQLYIPPDSPNKLSLGGAVWNDPVGLKKKTETENRPKRSVP